MPFENPTATRYRRALLYLVEHVGSIPRLRLQKVMYLIDLEHFHRYRRTLTGAPWDRYQLGPMNRAYLPSLALMAGFELVEEARQTSKGHVIKLLRRGPAPRFDASFDVAERETIDFILELTRELTDDEVVALAYETAPMRFLQAMEAEAGTLLIGTRIDFESMTSGANEREATDPEAHRAFKVDEAKRWRPVRDRALGQYAAAIDSPFLGG